VSLFFPNGRNGDDDKWRGSYTEVGTMKLWKNWQ